MPGSGPDPIGTGEEIENTASVPEVLTSLEGDRT